MNRLTSVVYRVSNLPATLEYYQKYFGFRVLTQTDNQAIVGFGDAAITTVVKISSDGQAHNLGTGYGHLALKAEGDIYAQCQAIKDAGGKVTREAGPVKGGTTVIAFVEDLDGKKFELIERDNSWKNPLLHLMIRVGDLEKSIEFYSKVLGMKELRRSENEQYKYTLAFVGYGREEENTVLELTYNWGVSSYELGDVFQKVVVSAENLQETIVHIEKTDAKVVAKTADSITVQDPTGYLIQVVGQHA